MKTRNLVEITPTIHHTDKFSYILINEVPVELRKEFMVFMNGQTTPYIENAVFSWDYINFLNKLFGRPSFFD